MSFWEIVTIGPFYMFATAMVFYAVEPIAAATKRQSVMAAALVVSLLAAGVLVWMITGVDTSAAG